MFFLKNIYRSFQGPNDWVLVLEDDTLIQSKDFVTVFPKIPAECDFVLLNPSTVVASEPVCKKTSVRWAHWGFVMSKILERPWGINWLAIEEY